MRGKHTTLIGLAGILSDGLRPRPEVTGVSPGKINSGQGKAETRVKVVAILGGILMKVRQGSSVQEVRVYTKDPDVTTDAIQEIVIKARAAISYGREEEIVGRYLHLTDQLNRRGQRQAPQ